MWLESFPFLHGAGIAIPAPFLYPGQDWVTANKSG